MKLPAKIDSKIKQEAVKNARFSWYQGWEKSSGYIKSELRGECRVCACRLYIKWEKKKAPTDEQVKEATEAYIDSLLRNEQHHTNQRDFRYYVIETFFVDVKRLEHEALLSVTDSLPLLIEILQASERFVEPSIQNLHNDLKNLYAGMSDHEALSRFLDVGPKRIGES